eukprot:361245-Chlamydomonas_euryale.AAC.1
MSVAVGTYVHTADGPHRTACLAWHMSVAVGTYVHTADGPHSTACLPLRMSVAAVKHANTSPLTHSCTHGLVLFQLDPKPLGLSPSCSLCAPHFHTCAPTGVASEEPGQLWVVRAVHRHRSH